MAQAIGQPGRTGGNALSGRAEVRPPVRPLSRPAEDSMAAHDHRSRDQCRSVRGLAHRTEIGQNKAILIPQYTTPATLGSLTGSPDQY